MPIYCFNHKTKGFSQTLVKASSMREAVDVFSRDYPWCYQNMTSAQKLHTDPNGLLKENRNHPFGPVERMMDL